MKAVFWLYFHVAVLWMKGICICFPASYLAYNFVCRFGLLISGLLAVRAYGVYRFRVMQGAMQYVLKGFNKKIECDEFRSRPEGCGGG